MEMNEKQAEFKEAKAGVKDVSIDAVFILDAAWIVAFFVMLFVYPEVGLESSREYSYQTTVDLGLRMAFIVVERVVGLGNILALIYCAGYGRFKGRKPLFPVSRWTYITAVVLMLAAILASSYIMDIFDTYRRVWMEMLSAVIEALVFIAVYIYGMYRLASCPGDHCLFPAFYFAPCKFLTGCI